MLFVCVGIFNGYPGLHDPVSHFFVQVVIIISLTRGLSLVGYYLKQPTVIFEIIAGILLGPSGFGRNLHYMDTVFGTKTLSNLNLVAQIGLVLYLFLVGMELDVTALRSNIVKAGGVAVCGMALPFGIGVWISKYVYDQLVLTDDTMKHKPEFLAFYVFMGTAMCITAFPVLARILKETGLIYTVPGSTALAAAAVNDCIAWCLLVLAVALSTGSDTKIAGWVFLSVMAYAVGLFTVVGPIFHYFVKWAESFNHKFVDTNLFALMMVMVFLSAWTTNTLGTDGIFGGFLMGLIVPVSLLWQV